MRRKTLVALLTTAVVCVFVTGCGSKTGDGMVAVSGTVLYSDGQPVTGELATIVFQPDVSNSPAKSASGTMQPDGTFVLSTNDADDGAYPGEYQVVLKVWSNYREQKLAVPKDYADDLKSPLTASVSESSEPFAFSVER